MVLAFAKWKCMITITRKSANELKTFVFIFSVCLHLLLISTEITSRYLKNKYLRLLIFI